MVQLSINAEQGFDYHLGLGAKLAPLRDRGVLIVGSGNIVHNLRGIDRSQPDDGFDWAQRFDEDAGDRMLDDPMDVARLDGHGDFRSAVPTPDHFLPLLYLAGLAGAATGGTEILVDGYAYGSLSMTSYTLGLADPPLAAHSGGPGDGAAAFPASMPADGTNT